jgi:site-specific recombinase XerD
LREICPSQNALAGTLSATPIRHCSDSTGAELKIMQELLRHSTIRVTLDTYTQAVTTAKRTAQDAVVALLFPEKTQET